MPHPPLLAVMQGGDYARVQSPAASSLTARNPDGTIGAGIENVFHVHHYRKDSFMSVASKTALVAFIFAAASMAPAAMAQGPSPEAPKPESGQAAPAGTSQNPEGAEIQRKLHGVA